MNKTWKAILHSRKGVISKQTFFLQSDSAELKFAKIPVFASLIIFNNTVFYIEYEKKKMNSIRIRKKHECFVSILCKIYKI